MTYLQRQKMKNKKLLILGLMMALMILKTEITFASDILRTSIMPVPGYLPRRGGAYIDGPTRGETGVPYTFTMNNGTDEGVTYYQLSVALNDNTHANGAADTFYDEYFNDPGTNNSYVYTFYIPGTYSIYIHRYDADKNPVYWQYAGREYDFVYKEIVITEGTGPNALFEKVQQVANECSKGDDYQTALAIDNWLSANVTYDHSATYYSPESALLDGISVCNGYSRGFALIAEYAGLETRRVVGGEHAWDAVKMDGDWYYVDPTWDDMDGSHLFFGINQIILDKTHVTENTVGGNVNCTELADNYLVRSGKWETVGRIIYPEMNNQVLQRAHIFNLSMGAAIYNEYGYNIANMENSDDQKFTNGHVIAYIFSNREWICDLTGEVFTGVFSYDFESNTIQGEFEAEDTLILPSDLTEIKSYAFADVGAYYAVIPDNVTMIGAFAFSGSKLWEISIPVTVTGFDDDAFTGTFGLVIRTPASSPAAQYAEAHNIKCITE